jgi:CxxC motif-containing protein
MLPVKTALPIPKEMVFTVMEEIRKITIEDPVYIGDVIQENIAGTGVALVATGNIPYEQISI